ncbi:MAG: methyltransferase domain-containing protein, partial [Ignavibacteria bacterium]
MTENFTDNNSIEKNIIHENEAIMGQNGASDNLSLEGEQFAEPVTPHNFNDFSYSKKSHFEIFQKNNYDKLFYGRVISPDGCDTKTYQNLLIFSFITQNIPEGKRILEIGCADNKVMNHFKYRYECWRIEDASLLTNTAVNIEKNEIEILKDNMGSIHKKLPLQHFDFIFSGSAFEQIPEDKPTLKIVLDNINRLLKPGGYSLHCFPGAISGIHFVYHRMLNFFFNNSAPLYYNVQQLTELLPLQKAVTDPDLQFIYEEVKREKVSGMDSYLKMVSFNFLYRKNISELAVKTEIRPEHYFRKQPCYAFHHLMKCGGTSVKEILQEWFNIKYDYIEDSDDLYSFLNYRLKTANFTGESCIIGHFQFDGIYLH